MLRITVTSLLVAAVAPASAEDEWTADQRAVLVAVERLGAATAALAEAWGRAGGGWKLLRVDVHPVRAE
jgi:hypothetical protein